jgi:hypothetical protein
MTSCSRRTLAVFASATAETPSLRRHGQTDRSRCCKVYRRNLRRRTAVSKFIRNCVYYPGVDFSSSIKVIAPVPCPDITCGDLEEITEGGKASTAFWPMARGLTDAKNFGARPTCAGAILSMGYMGDGAAMLIAGPAVKAAQPMKRTGRETPAKISWCFHQ